MLCRIIICLSPLFPFSFISSLSPRSTTPIDVTGTPPPPSYLHRPSVPSFDDFITNRWGLHKLLHPTLPLTQATYQDMWREYCQLYLSPPLPGEIPRPMPPMPAWFETSVEDPRLPPHQQQPTNDLISAAVAQLGFARQEGPAPAKRSRYDSGVDGLTGGAPFHSAASPFQAAAPLPPAATRNNPATPPAASLLNAASLHSAAALKRTSPHNAASPRLPFTRPSSAANAAIPMSLAMPSLDPAIPFTVPSSHASSLSPVSSGSRHAGSATGSPDRPAGASLHPVFPSSGASAMAALPGGASDAAAESLLPPLSAPLEPHSPPLPPSHSKTGNNNNNSAGGRRRGPRVAVPDDKKDPRYWEKRRKNNESAKRSRDNRRERERANRARAVELARECDHWKRVLSAATTEMHRLEGSLRARGIRPPYDFGLAVLMASQEKAERDGTASLDSALAQIPK